MKVFGAVLAVVLLAFAIIFALRGIDYGVLSHASWSVLAPMAILVAANLIVTGLLFWAVTLSFDARPVVSVRRMIELICVSALLNYVPVVRPGLWGRVAYLKARHDLPLKQSLLILLLVMAVAVAVSAAGTLTIAPIGPPAARWAVVAGIFALLTLFTGPTARRLIRRRVVMPWLWIPLRVLDLLAVAGRLWLAFRVMGQPISYDQAVVAAAAALLVRLAGLTPNGLGLSEWAVAALAHAMAPVSTAVGVAAALLDRAVEVVVILIAAGLSAPGLRD